MTVTLVDLGYGNLGSIRTAFARLGAEVQLTSGREEIGSAERLVLPGVGSAGFAMARLEELALAPVIRSFAKPLLGICLGMQLLFEWSEEDGTSCLGLIEGTVRRLTPAPGLAVPHMGWARLTAAQGGAGLATGDYLWFAHSFAAEVGPNCTAQTRFGEPIAAAVRRDNFMGCQFHPERSSEAGARFLRAFLKQ